MEKEIIKWTTEEQNILDELDKSLALSHDSPFNVGKIEVLRTTGGGGLDFTISEPIIEAIFEKIGKTFPHKNGLKSGAPLKVIHPTSEITKDSVPGTVGTLVVNAWWVSEKIKEQLDKIVNKRCETCALYQDDTGVCNAPIPVYLSKVQGDRVVLPEEGADCPCHKARWIQKIEAK